MRSREPDDAIVKLTYAVDIARVVEAQPSKERTFARATVHQQATDLLDEHVAKSRRPDEDPASCTARLARDGDVTSVKPWEVLRVAQGQ